MLQILLLGSLFMPGQTGKETETTDKKVAATEGTGKDTISQWNGFEKRDFVVAGRKALLVLPAREAPGKPWIWRTEFFGHEPQADIALIKKGFHAAYIDLQDLYGAPVGLNAMDKFYDHLTGERGLGKKVVLEGFSRGGLFSLNWAARHPDRVACIYNDAPVCDFKSWPLGQGAGKASPADWKKCLKAYGFTQKQALEYGKNPIDNLEPLAQAKIPILHVCGDADEVVPFWENTMLMYRRYKGMEAPMEVIAKPGVKHHPHSLKDPKPIVDFILKHTTGTKDNTPATTSPDTPEKSPVSAMDATVVGLRGSLIPSRRQFADGKGHVVFMGGSITEMNGYRPLVMAGLKKRFPNTVFTFTSAGIASTCSTTGAFRLQEDVLAKGPVDLLLVEFAVNDDQDALHSRRDCIRGMEGIILHTRQHNPRADIVMIHFVNESMLEKLAQAKEPVSSGAHEYVARRHGISSIHLAREVSSRIRAGKLTWQQYGGVHPALPGNQLAADLVGALFDRASVTPLGKEVVGDYQVTTPIDPNSYARGRFLANDNVKRGAGFELSVPDWKNLKGDCRERFRELPLLWSSTPGSEMRATFSGKTLGAYVLAGPDAGKLEVSVDDGPFRLVPLKHAYSGGLHYPRTVILASDLSEGEHTARLRVGQPSPGKSEGTAVRIVRLGAD